MNVSDLAYVIQTKSPGSPDITQPAYQFNLLHLKVERGESVTLGEADWSISTANLVLWTGSKFPDLVLLYQKGFLVFYRSFRLAKNLFERLP